MTSRQVIFSFTLSLLTPNVVFGEAQCPGNAETVRYHSSGLSQIAVSVSINHSGPYEFIVDTGSQLTIVEPSLREELKLQPQGSIGISAVGNLASADLVAADVIEVGPNTVHQPLFAVAALTQFQALDPHVRGILGENFLAHFDLLIDHGHKLLCFDETKRMQQELKGEHVPVLDQRDRHGDLPFSQPILVVVHLHGDSVKGTVLNLDSGTNVPLLFANHLETVPWLPNNHARQASTVGEVPSSYATMPSQDVTIGARLVRQIAFLTPVSTGRPLAKMGEDGLLPTSLFKRVLISYADHFVIFEPR